VPVTGTSPGEIYRAAIVSGKPFPITSIVILWNPEAGEENGRKPAAPAAIRQYA